MNRKERKIYLQSLAYGPDLANFYDNANKLWINLNTGHVDIFNYPHSIRLEEYYPEIKENILKKYNVKNSHELPDKEYSKLHRDIWNKGMRENVRGWKTKEELVLESTSLKNIEKALKIINKEKPELLFVKSLLVDTPDKRGNIYVDEGEDALTAWKKRFSIRKKIDASIKLSKYDRGLALWVSPEGKTFDISKGEGYDVDKNTHWGWAKENILKFYPDYKPKKRQTVDEFLFSKGWIRVYEDAIDFFTPYVQNVKDYLMMQYPEDKRNKKLFFRINDMDGTTIKEFVSTVDDFIESDSVVYASISMRDKFIKLARIYTKFWITPDGEYIELEFEKEHDDLMGGGRQNTVDLLKKGYSRGLILFMSGENKLIIEAGKGKTINWIIEHIPDKFEKINSVRFQNDYAFPAYGEFDIDVENDESVLDAYKNFVRREHLLVASIRLSNRDFFKDNPFNVDIEENEDSIIFTNGESPLDYFYAIINKNTNTAHMYELHIEEDKRGKGYGRQMVNWFLDICRKLRIKHVTGIPERAARPFWKKMDFELFETPEETEYDKTLPYNRSLSPLIVKRLEQKESNMKMSTGDNFKNKKAQLAKTKEERFYESGMCDAYAIALSRKTGFPIAVVRGWYKDSSGENTYEDAHMFVKDGNYGLDIKGKRYIGDIVRDCVFINKVYKITTPIISEEEAKECFTMGDLEPDIQEASEYIDRMKDLKKTAQEEARDFDDFETSYKGVTSEDETSVDSYEPTDKDSEDEE